MVRTAFFAGEAIKPWLSHLARLRVAVFRDWPYLYEGSETNEQTYLSSFATCPNAGLAVALDGDSVVGCSTCLSLAAESDGIQAPFRARGWETARFLYFGESVLLHPYRGQGVGVAFFTLREAHARAVSACDYATFCAVQRPADHPLRPHGAVPLDEFWRRRGFSPYPDLACVMRWKQVDTTEPVANRLAFWIKPLRDAALP
jgi:GNAT superfamily N-acetyltransferase